MSPTARDARDRVQELLPLTNLAYHVLLALGDGAAHGYAVGKSVHALSHGMLDPATGSLYQVLKRLDQAGLVDRVEGTANERRREFELTALGREVLAAETRRLAELVDTARATEALNDAR